MPTRAAPQEEPSTRKGRATRERIVAAAADLMYRRGVAGTSTPAVRDAAGVSSSQIYHYFADKDDLTRAVITFQSEAILSHQAPLLARLDSIEALRSWREVVVDAARRQNGAGGCPLGTLSSELSDDHPWARDALAASFTEWSEAIRAGLAAMVDNGSLRPETDATTLSLALLAAVQGGLVLAQAQHTTEALEAALDAVITHIHDHAIPPA
ncbi:TetR/AcrR family transcriptional regulator [Streptomyces sp. NBC_00963]|uniref:TetR/AcrR family transcriptional regulator n=1 Tax=unclassified Streptomyces TaxID=2593676 RepID=UPI00224E3223|nr:TetR/AcrR family transcriptional regulator [Streptomyces sp. NBC_01306]MCX4729263.1 TetR/AcrR family transcriptional regulator [Streptomyces sp. NBC_01306]WSX46676.1 TetR/AcrR family transcriptional regulator [Streptomyces sp. NBC_00963]